MSEPVIEEQQLFNKVTFGFWVYLMTDCVLFASLFSIYAVLQGNTFGGPSGADIFNLPFVLTETLILLTSSFTCGMVLLAARKNNKNGVIGSLAATFVFGAIFLGMEISEFSHLVHMGNSWQRNGFLSAYFTLVGTHGLHILVGLLWIIALKFYVYKRGLTTDMIRKLTTFSLYWHFLDIVWVFIFTIVYLMGKR